MRQGSSPSAMRYPTPTSVKMYLGWAGFFNFPADVGHVDAQDFVVALGAGPPELLHEKVIGQHTSGIFAQQRHGCGIRPG